MPIYFLCHVLFLDIYVPKLWCRHALGRHHLINRSYTGHPLCLALQIPQVTEMLRIKEEVARVALVNNSVAITVIDSGQCLRSSRPFTKTFPESVRNYQISDSTSCALVFVFVDRQRFLSVYARLFRRPQRSLSRW